MATHLLDELKALVTPQLLSAASSRLGESEASVSKALFAAFPLILAALMPKLKDSTWISQIMSLFTGRANFADVLANPKGALVVETPNTPVTELGGNLLAGIFGNQSGAAARALGNYA